MSSLTHRGELARPADPGRDASLTDRQRREAAYYAEFAARNAPASIDFTPVTSTRRRPWSPFWTVCQAVRDVPDPGDKSLLDLGCGMGGAAVRFAKVGYQRVAGLDVSDANLAVARRLAERYDLGDRCDFAPGVAERLPWPDASFDVVTVIDLLHHVENDRAAAEIHRVLKPGGLLVIKEPVRAPVIERLRDSRLGRWLAPGATSTDPEVHITEDERKLSRAEVDAVLGRFKVERVHRFSLTTRLARLLPRRWYALVYKLMLVDSLLFRLFPPLSRLGDVMVVTARRA